MFDSELLIAAFQVAATAHRKQKRKGTDTPYIVHPMGVASIVLEAGGGDRVVAAALLHDVLEDTNYPVEEMRSKFGDVVVALVEAVTNPSIDWKTLRTNEEVQLRLTEYRQAYFKRIANASADVQLLSAADKLHNARSILNDLFKDPENTDRIWDRFRGKRDGTIWYYKELAEIFSKGVARVRPLGAELVQVTRDMDTRF